MLNRRFHLKDLLNRFRQISGVEDYSYYVVRVCRLVAGELKRKDLLEWILLVPPFITGENLFLRV
jgi:hypothetical protein